MYLSHNDIKQFTPHTLAPEKLARLLTEKVVEVEGVHRWDLDGVVVGEVKAITAHPQADRLRLVETSVGSRTLTIVCGGKNLYPGERVAVALEGAMVRWHGQGEKVKLEPATIRGVKSEGMICAASELDLPIADTMDASVEAPAILDLTRFIPKAKAGTPLDKALGLDDVRYEIDNKSLARRADLWGYLGMAREVSIITNTRMKNLTLAKIRYSKPHLATVEDRLGCQRYIAARIDNVSVTESPWEVQRKLIQAGLRPINLIVDLTNLVMIELGQPLHAFDAGSVDRIIVRKAKKGEKLIALNGKEYQLQPVDCVIANSNGPMALAGIIGGEHSGIQNDTVSIIVEAATFDSVMVRKTSQRLLLRTDSSARFEKGQPVESAGQGLSLFVSYLKRYQPNAMLVHAESLNASATKPKKVVVDGARLDALIGKGVVSFAHTKRILQGLGLAVQGPFKRFVVTTPYWRNDIEIPEDVAEEVSRLFGFNAIPHALPTLPAIPPVRDARRDCIEAFRTFLVERCAINETESYPFEVPQALSDDRQRLEVVSPISQDSKWLRTDIAYNLLSGVSDNLRYFESVRMFEIGKVFHAGSLSPYLVQTGVKKFLPEQSTHAVVALSGDHQTLRIVKGYIEQWGIQGGWKFILTDGSEHPLLEDQASLDIVCNGHVIGIVGVVGAEALKRFNIKTSVVLWDINLDELLTIPRQARGYHVSNPYPSVLRDMAIVVDQAVAYARLEQLFAHVGGLLQSVELFDQYEGQGLSDGKKSLAFHLTFSSSERTLTSDEVDTAMKQIVLQLEQQIGATIR